jgi:ABC-type nitrate/sulfonate/bicarbonate transport system ATPase subunit
MADRIMVLSARPATIQATFEVPLARPRNLSSAQVVALKASILGEFGLSWEGLRPIGC